MSPLACHRLALTQSLAQGQVLSLSVVTSVNSANTHVLTLAAISLELQPSM